MHQSVSQTFCLPDLGEGLAEARIVSWHVQPGDQISLDAPLLSVETAKAVVEIPSPLAGKIVTLHASAGAVVKTGSVLVTFKTTDAPTHEQTNEQTYRQTQNSHTVAGSLPEGSTLFTGSGFAASTETTTGTIAAASTASAAGKASPAIRALAQQLQVDLSKVTPSGPHGSITRADVEANSYLRQTMGKTLEAAYQQVVPVTIMEDAYLINWQNGFDVSVAVIQALVRAVVAEPVLNARWEQGKLIPQHQLNLGIACDSTHGLIVPVLPNVAALSAEQLRQQLNQLKQQVANRSLSPAQLQGASFTLSNFGIFAGRYANPIVVPPQVGILAVGRLRDEVAVIKGQMQICKVLPLSLSFDHRAATGGEASRFLRELLRVLRDT
jgi:2-oxoisovalerate dehydrogenase E2 component (dihydrolipoyl transacylase)